MVGTMAFAFSNIDFGDDGGRRCEHGSWFRCKCKSRLVDIFDERTRRLSFDVLALLLSTCRFDFDMHTLSPTCASGFLLQWFVDTPFLFSYRCWSWYWPHVCSACSQGISTVNLLLQLLARVAFLNFSTIVIFDLNENLSTHYFRNRGRACIP